MPKRRVKTTRLDIIKCATNMFLEQGYSSSSSTMICDILDISGGNLTYYFPSKEHLLAELVDMLCDFQWKMMEAEADDGISSVLAICLELAMMAAICETDPVAKDFYISAYTSPICLEIIRRNDMARAKQVFGAYCPEWTDEKYAEAEVFVSGIEYATLLTVGEPVSLEARISGALDTILRLYNIPEETRKVKIQKVMSMDYRGVSTKVMDSFRKYVAMTTEQAIEDLYTAKGLVYKK